MAGNVVYDDDDERTVDDELELQQGIYDTIRAETKTKNKSKDKSQVKGRKGKRKEPITKEFITPEDDSDLEVQHTSTPADPAGQGRQPAAANRSVSLPPASAPSTVAALSASKGGRLPVTIPLRLLDGEKPTDPRTRQQPALRFADYRLREWPMARAESAPSTIPTGASPVVSTSSTGAVPTGGAATAAPAVSCAPVGPVATPPAAGSGANAAAGSLPAARAQHFGDF